MKKKKLNDSYIVSGNVSQIKVNFFFESRQSSLRMNRVFLIFNEFEPDSYKNNSYKKIYVTTSELLTFC